MARAFYFSSVLMDFLFKDFSVSTTGGIFAVSFIVGLIPIVSELLHFLRDIISRKQESLKNVKTVSSESTNLRTGLVPISKFNNYCFRSLFLGILSMLHILDILCYYIIMLTLSTLNAWLTIAILIGSAIAYFVLDPMLTHDFKMSNFIASNSDARLEELRDSMNSINVNSVKDQIVSASATASVSCH